MYLYNASYSSKCAQFKGVDLFECGSIEGWQGRWKITAENYSDIENYAGSVFVNTDGLSDIKTEMAWTCQIPNNSSDNFYGHCGLAASAAALLKEDSTENTKTCNKINVTSTGTISFGRR